MKDYKAIGLTMIQFTLIFLMLWSMPWICSNLLLLVIEAIGFLIAFGAIFEMNKSKLNISPTPRENATLIKSGIYHWVRHPMYLSLFLIFMPLLIENCSILNLCLFTLFSINILIKLHYEEFLLRQFFAEYSDYQKKTWKIIPYLY